MVDNNELDGVETSTTVDTGVDVTKDTTTPLPVAPLFSPRARRTGGR